MILIIRRMFADKCQLEDTTSDAEYVKQSIEKGADHGIFMD